MKKVFAAVLTALVIVLITLAAVFGLVETTLKVAATPNPVVRALALCLELVLGILLLLGTVYLATHIAVRIYSSHPKETENQPGAGR
jgi:hypothetical protein